MWRPFAHAINWGESQRDEIRAAGSGRVAETDFERVLDAGQV